MSDILKLNKTNQTFTSENLADLMQTHETEEKLIKINNKDEMEIPLTTYLAVVNDQPDTVYYINVEYGDRGDSLSEPTRKYFINDTNGGKTEITSETFKEDPQKISVWKVAKPKQTPAPAPAPVTPTPEKKSMFDGLKSIFSTKKGGRKSKKQRKSRKSKQSKSRRSRR